MVQAREDEGAHRPAVDVEGKYVPDVFDASQVMRLDVSALRFAGAELLVLKAHDAMLLHSSGEHLKCLEISVFRSERAER